MTRFAGLAAVFAVLTFWLLYEAVRFTVFATRALAGIGVPRAQGPGLINLGLALLTFYLAWLMQRMMRMQWAIDRAMRSRHPDHAA